MADRIVVMDKGRIQQVASPRELYERPANTFVARFIGTPPMNLIPASALPDADLPQGGSLGIRPVVVTMSTRGIPARLAGVEYLGADQLATFEIGSAPVPTPVLVRLPARQSLASDGHALAWPSAAAHRFGPDGLRLA